MRQRRWRQSNIVNLVQFFSDDAAAAESANAEEVPDDVEIQYDDSPLEFENTVPYGPGNWDPKVSPHSQYVHTKKAIFVPLLCVFIFCW